MHLTLSRLRSLLAVVSAATVLIGGLAVATPAQASPVPLVKATGHLVYGDRTVTVAWRPVPHASSYTLRYTTSKTGKQLRSVTTSKTYAAVTGLKNGQRVYFQLEAKAAGYASSKSAVTAATPQAGYPQVMPTVKVQPGAAADTVQVSWDGLRQATKVVVMASAYNDLSGPFFTSAWLPATQTSYTLSVPAKYRSLLGTGTGRAIYVRVGQYNDAHASGAVLKAANYNAHYRISKAGSFSLAHAISPSGTQLKVATYNVQSVTASPADHPWSERRTRVAAAIEYAGADLVAAQEDNSSASSQNSAGVPQYKDLGNLLAQTRYGYRLSGDLPTNYRFNNDLTDSWLYYNPSVLTRLDGGIVSPRSDLGISYPQGLVDRRGTWAKFRINSTGSVFYALTIHLEVGDNAKALRLAEAKGLDRYLKAKAGAAPSILLGDMNSSAYRDGYEVSQQLHDLGWYDSAATEGLSVREGWRYQSANTPQAYPTVPEQALNVNTGRIDYIFTNGMPGAYHYVNQVVLNAGQIVPAYQGSDHNLQWALLGVPATD
jgi:endonuclease/exonuclease/phosphatase family metal-dependent hydrolase